jgi:N-acetylmuramoyl-L-alanine amidase CwlD
MRKTLVAGLLLLHTLGCCAWAAPPPDPDQSETGLWGNVTVQGPTTLRVNVRGQKFSMNAYATSIGDEFLVAADHVELNKIAALFGGKFEWDSESLTLRCTCRGVTRTLKLDERKVQGPAAVAGAQEAELPLPAQVIQDKGHIPLSALEDFLDTRVTVRANQQVFIEPLLRSVRFEGTSRKPKLILESTAPVTYKCFTLKNPDRYVIDVAGAVIDTPSLTVQHPDLGNVRLGQFELGPAISRVVVPMGNGVQVRQETWGARESMAWQLQIPRALAQPEVVDIEDVRMEKTDKGNRLIITGKDVMRFEWQRLGSPNPRWWLDIPQANLKNARQEFEIAGKFSGSVRLSQNQPAPNPVVRVVIDLDQAVEVTTSAGDSEKQLVIDILDKELDLSAAVSKGKGSTGQSAMTGSGLIVIDPGHGGSDCGAINKSLGLSEAEVTLDICKRLAVLLKAQGWNVVMTRTQDVDVSYAGSSAREELGARVKVANEAKADMFLSVHCNASVSPSSHGTSLHYYKQSDYVLASELQQAVLSSTGRSNRGLQANRFYVLAHTQMPAVLVETAFLTNASEGALLNDPAYRQKIADGLAQGLRQYASRQLNWGTASK